MATISEATIINKLATFCEDIEGVKNAYPFASSPDNLALSMLPAIIFLPSAFQSERAGHKNSWKNRTSITGVLFVSSLLKKGGRLSLLEAAVVPFGTLFRQKFQDPSVVNSLLDLGATGFRIVSGEYGAGGTMLTFNGVQYIGWVFEWETQSTEQRTYQQEVLATSPLAYWPLEETSGTVAVNAEGTSDRDGTYGSDVSGWGTGEGLISGKTAPHFQGNGYVIQIYSDSLKQVMNYQEGSMMIWGRAPVSEWSNRDNTRHLMTIAADGNGNQVLRLWKGFGPVNHFLTLQRLVTGANWFGTDSPITVGGGWFCLLLTWSVSKNEGGAYVNGVKQAPGIAGVSIKTITPAELHNFTTVIGSYRHQPGSPDDTRSWNGWLGHAAIWDRPLLPEEAISLSRL